MWQLEKLQLPLTIGNEDISSLRRTLEPTNNPQLPQRLTDKKTTRLENPNTHSAGAFHLSQHPV